MAFLLNTEITIGRQRDRQKDQVMHQAFLHRTRVEPVLAVQDAAAVLEVPAVVGALAEVAAAVVLVENDNDRKAAEKLQLFCHGI